MRKSKIFFVVALFVLVSSCGPMKEWREHNYFSGSQYYNDTLNISAKFFGDMKFSEPDRKTFRNFKNLNGLKYRDLLFVGTTFIEPFYDLLFFYHEERPGQYSVDDKPITKIVFHDSTDESVLYRKSLKGKVISIYLIPHNRKSSVLKDAEQLINTVRFDAPAKDELTFSDVFNSYKNENNILYVLNKFDTAPILETRSSEWMKFQYLATILSKVPDYNRFSEMIENSEKNKRKYLDDIISTIDSTEIITSLEAVLNSIENLSKNEKVIMLNEMHWLPKHRIFAYKLLEILKENGYRYFAVEAVDKEKVLKLNDRSYPLASTGYYTKEPFFGILLRKAKELGFEIVSYDEFETDNREKAQASNLKTIFDKDPDAKMFVYAGIDHILEKSPSQKRMAEYFTELTAINPLTIDQVEITGNGTEKISLVKAGLFEGNGRINTAVDYFVINNMGTKLNEIYGPEKLVDFQFEIDEMKNYKNQELFLSVYFQDEYSKHKSNSVPLLNGIIEIAEPKINLSLPIGDYHLRIWNASNLLIFSKEFAVK